MASFHEETIRFFSGLSSETKPTAAAGDTVPNGSRWREVDTAKTFHYNKSDDTWYQAERTIDSSTHALNVVDYPHHEIHGGSAFFANYSALADDTDIIEVRVQTPNTTKWAHMVFDLSSALASFVEFFAATTKTDVPGNRITPYNRNFNSSATSGLTICHTPGGAQAGTGNLSQYIGSASTSGKNDSGGGTSSRHEFILAQNTAYLLRITSRSDGNALTITMDWYEHTDKG